MFNFDCVPLPTQNTRNENYPALRESGALTAQVDGVGPELAAGLCFRSRERPDGALLRRAPPACGGACSALEPARSPAKLPLTHHVNINHFKHALQVQPQCSISIASLSQPKTRNENYPALRESGALIGHFRERLNRWSATFRICIIHCQDSS